MLDIPALGSSVKVTINIMEQHNLKNENNCLNTNIYSNLETSVGQISNPYLNVILIFNTKAD